MPRIKGPDKKGTAYVSINRVSSNVEPYSFIELEIVDEESSIQFCSVRMGFEELSKILTGAPQGGLKLTTRGLDYVGKTREHKTEVVTVPGGVHDYSEDELRAMMANHEKDGWTGRFEDMKNHHNFVKGGVKVLFERWV